MLFLNSKKVIILLTIGKITGTHGLKGDLKILPLTDYPERYFNLKQVFVGNENKHQCMEIEKVSKHKNFYLFKFKAIADINDAEHLKNDFLLIKEEDAVVLPEDTFFIHDIIGLEAYLNNGSYLGKVKEVIETGSNDVYVINGEAGEKLIPALKDVVSIDLKNKKIIVNDMPGLLKDAEEV